MTRARPLRVAFLLCLSCATQSGMRQATLKRASFDLGCDARKLETVELSSADMGSTRVFGVSGCEKKATYIVKGDGVNGYTVVLNSDPNGK